MASNLKHLWRVMAATLLAMSLAWLPRAAQAQEEPAPLSAADGADFLGKWTVSMDMMGNLVEMTLTLEDVDGIVAGSLSSDLQPEARGSHAGCA